MLAGWTASPARLREDANAEDDLVYGSYRDRVLVELAQNAADAATRAGVAGRLRIRLEAGPDGTTLRAANTGAALDADGVAALATLRASAKREPGSIGRYGVGFAAVLAVSDTPRIVSTSGGVGFSAATTVAELAGLPELTAELERRHGRPPALRLPYPAAGHPPDGFDTEVVLPLRSEAVPVVTALLTALPADLLLALSGLAELDLPGRLVTATTDGADVVLTDAGVDTRWRQVTRTGRWNVTQLADRPVEDRERVDWRLTWAVPIEGDRVRPLAGRQILYGPTPTDEPLSLPARLIADFPLGPDRRRVVTGTEAVSYLVGEVAAAYRDLLAGLPADPAVLGLVPRVGLAADVLDADICSAVLTELRRAPWLPAADRADTTRLPARRATYLDPVGPELVDAVVDIVPGLLPAGWSTRTQGPALAALGVHRVALAELVGALSTVDRPGHWWAAVYAGLAAVGPIEDTDALASLPIPLADGRLGFGARGVLLPAAGQGTAGLSALGLRVVDADAAHPWLAHLGALPADPAAMLTDPAVAAAVQASMEDEDPEPVTDAVLGLVAATTLSTAELPWLADLSLPDADGGIATAGELVLPGSPFADLLEPGSLGTVDAALLDRWGADTLCAVGVLATFAVRRRDDGEPDPDIDGAEDWYDAVCDRLPDAAEQAPPRVERFVAVLDLDRVRPERWPAALELLAGMPRDVLAPARLLPADGRSLPVPSYTRWWLDTHPVLDGQRPDRLRRADAPELAGLYDVAPPSAVELGVLSTVDDALADPDRAAELLQRLGDPRRSLPAATLAGIYPRLAQALAGHDVRPPDRVRTVTGQVVPAADAVVLDAPHLLSMVDGPIVAGGGAADQVADLLDLPLASETTTAAVTSSPECLVDWSDVPGADVAAARLGLAGLTGRVALHRGLTAGDRPVTWWAGDHDDPDHVDIEAGPEALGRALAWRCGRWARRTALAEAFAHPRDTVRLQTEDGVD